MPVAYIPKPIKIKNIDKVTKLGIDITKLSRSQAKGLDEFINLTKKANKRSDLREDINDLIYDFAEYLKPLKSPQVRDTLRSIRIQIASAGKHNQEPKRYKFEIGSDIAEYLKGK